MIPRWKQVTDQNFSTHNYEMHKAYADVLRSLLDSSKKLKEMVHSIRDAESEYEYEEEGEDEVNEAAQNDNKTEQQSQMQNAEHRAPEAPGNVQQLQANDHFVDSILKNAGDKRRGSGQIFDGNEVGLKRQRIDNLRVCYYELLDAHDVYEKKASEYRSIKQGIDFINTPKFLKFG